jgi:hypothetical protein
LGATLNAEGIGMDDLKLAAASVGHICRHTEVPAVCTLSFGCLTTVVTDPGCG